MTKKEEIENEVWGMWQIVMFARECFHYSFYLAKPETKKEQDYIISSQDFAFFRLVLWRTYIIELSKLFSKLEGNDRFNIFRFIKKLKKGEYWGDIGISMKTISCWEDQIAASNDIIEQVLNLRDKVYAHTDKDKEKYDNSQPTYEETEKLIEIIESVIKEIYEVVFHSGVLMETMIFDKNRFNIIKILADVKEKEINDLMAHFTKQGKRYTADNMALKEIKKEGGLIG